jgi:hypothetical protein
MTRSLRELNRPRSIAYWSQGAHHGWGGRSGGRERRSPTPDELRQQAYHALASRITSLYWFNLSLRSLVAFPDLIEPITRVGREVRMLDDYYLEGDAVSHERVLTNGDPTWDLDVIAGPSGALMFALDLTYRADRDERVFKFAAPRECKFTFPLPSYIRAPAEVFRVDADGVAAVEHVVNDGQVTIRDQVSGVAIYVAAAATGVRDRIEARRRDLVAVEDAMGFLPGQNGADLDVLRRILDAGER